MDGAILTTRDGSTEYIKFIGTVRYSHCAGLESHINQLFNKNDFNNIVVDLEQAEILDSTALGLLARVAIELEKSAGLRPVIFLKRGELSNVLKRVCFDQVFTIILDDNIKSSIDFKELPTQSEGEKQVLQRVVDAHRNLAKLDKKNEQLYQDITDALQS
jgi:anti-anti-sigma regulatory factor